MSERNKLLADAIVHEIMLSMVALYHAAVPLLLAFLALHQDRLIKGDLSVFTQEAVAGLVFSILATAWKTKQQRAADPIVPEVRS